MQQSLDKVYICGETEPDELLGDFFCGQVTLLVGVPSLEDLLCKLHVFPLFDNLHTCILAKFDPCFDPLFDHKLVFAEPIDDLLLVLVVNIPHNFQQTVLRDLRSSTTF